MGSKRSIAVYGEQRTLTERRIAALRIALTLIEKEQGGIALCSKS